MVGSDPVAIDRIGHDIIVKKRIEEGVQEEDNPRYRRFIEMAQDLKLGVGDIEKITLKTVSI